MIVVILWAVIFFAITIAIDPYYPVILVVSILIVCVIWWMLTAIKNLIKK